MKEIYYKAVKSKERGGHLNGSLGASRVLTKSFFSPFATILVLCVGALSFWYQPFVGSSSRSLRSAVL